MYKTSKTLAIAILGLLILTPFSSCISGEETSGNEEILYVEYAFDDVQIENIDLAGTQFTRVRLSDESNVGEPGEPVLPVSSAQILLPYGAEIDDIQVNKGEEFTLPVSYFVEPGQDSSPLLSIGAGSSGDSGVGEGESEGGSGEEDSGLYLTTLIDNDLGGASVDFCVHIHEQTSDNFVSHWTFYQDGQPVGQATIESGSGSKDCTRFTFDIMGFASSEVYGHVYVVDAADSSRSGSATTETITIGAGYGGGSGGYTGPNNLIYGSNSLFPGKDYEVVTIQKFRGYNIAVLQLYPVQYNPVEGTLIYTTSMELQISTKEMQAADNENFRGLQKDIDAVSEKVDNSVTVSTYPGPFPSHTYEYVIITNEELKNYDGEFSFQELADEYTALGLNSIIVTVEEIYAGVHFPADGIDDQQKIRNFIRNAYNTWHTEYVLLGGDDDIVPARNLYYGYAQGYGHISGPSDIYYSCLDGPYNGDGDDVWGEPRDGENGGDVDLYAEVFVGRAPVGSNSEIYNFVKKTIAYMYTYWGDSGEPHTEYLNKALWLGEYLFGSILSQSCPNTWGKEYKDEMIGGSDANGYSTVGVPVGGPEGFDVDTLYDKEWIENGWPEVKVEGGHLVGGWSKTDLINKMNDNVHIINHLGHGNVGYAMKMTSDDVSALTNTEYSFVYSQTCLAGSFGVGDCFAEEITVKTDNGAFASIMNSRFGWGQPGGTNGPSQHFDREFWDAIYGENITALGKANADSKEDNLYRIQGDRIRWCYYTLNLFGDPALRIRKVGDAQPTPVNQPVAKPIHVAPYNGIEGIDVAVELSVEVFDLNRDYMDVSFYDASDDSLIKKITKVKHGSIATHKWTDLEYNTIYRWYAFADDSNYANYEPHYNATSDVFSFTTIKDPESDEDWWDENWVKRKPVMLSSDAVNTFDDSDQSITIIVDYEAGMQPDYDDLRFVKYDDGATELKYWVDPESTNEDCAVVWIKLTDCPIYKIQRACLWIYYGNDEAESNGNVDWFKEDNPVKQWDTIPTGESQNNVNRKSWAVKTIVDSEHNIIVGGGRRLNGWVNAFNPRDPWYLVVKVDSDGNRVWDNEFTSDPDGLYQGSSTMADDGDHLTDIALDSQDDVIITGYSDDNEDAEGDNWPPGLPPPQQGFGSGEVYFGYDFLTIKLDGYSGEELWRHRYGGRNGRTFVIDADDGSLITVVPPQYFAHGVAADSQDNIYVVGNKISAATGRSDLLILAYSPNGEVLWEKLYTGNDIKDIDWNTCPSVPVSDIKIDSEDNLILCGGIDTEDHIFNNPIDKDAYVLKLDNNGEIVWVKTFDAGLDFDIYDYKDEYSYEMALDSDGNIVVNTNYGIMKIDSNGNKISEVIEKYPPVADAGDDQPVIPAGTATFDASGSYDPDDYVVSYKWYSSEGDIVGTGVTYDFTVPYGAPGAAVFEFILEVEDINGLKDYDVVSAYIMDAQPIPPPDSNSWVPIRIDIDPGGPFYGDYMGEIGEPIAFQGEIKFRYKGDPYRRMPYRFLVDWNFGDGTNETIEMEMAQGPVTNESGLNTSTFNVKTNHTYNVLKKGRYPVTLTVKPSPNDISGFIVGDFTSFESNFAKIHGCEPELPIALLAGSSRGILGLPVEFDASNSWDLDGYITAFEWDFGDGATDNSEKTSHLFEREGTYTVTLTVTDNDCQTDSRSTQVIIQDWSLGYSGGFVSLDSIGHIITMPYRRVTTANVDTGRNIGPRRILELDSNYNVVSTFYNDADVGLTYHTTDGIGDLRYIIISGYQGNMCRYDLGGLYIAKYGYYSFVMDPDINAIVGLGSNGGGSPILAYSPWAIDFGDMQEGESATETFTVWNMGDGTINYEITTSVDWLDVLPTTGSSSGQYQVNTHTVTINTTGMPSREHLGQINIGASPITIEVNIVNPAQDPILSTSSTQHNFGNKLVDEVDSATFEIWNSGAETLTYTLEETCDWFEISSINGDSTGITDQDTITISINTTGLTKGTHSDTILIESNGGNKTFTVTVKVVEEISVLSISNPKAGALYFLGEKIRDIPLFKNLAIIIGPIKITANATGLSNGKVEFYIDDELKDTVTDDSFNYEIKSRMFGRFKIKAIAYDSEDSEVANDEIDVIIFCFRDG